MGGAPITVTFYQNGIHVTESDPAFFEDPALAAEMARAFDAKDEERLNQLSGPVTRNVPCAVDTVGFADARGELYTKPYVSAEEEALHHSGHFKW